MTGNEIRKSFVDFFKSKEHKHFESASLKKRLNGLGNI